MQTNLSSGNALSSSSTKTAELPAADTRRGREWRSGPQQLFGPYEVGELPDELLMVE